MKRLAAQAEALCRTVAPDVAGVPVYVLLATELPGELGCHWPAGLAGVTCTHLDLILRPTLERLGRWRGRGPAMVLSPQAIKAELADLGRPARRRCFPRVFLGVALHELAHVIDGGTGTARGPEPAPDFVTFAGLVLRTELAGATAPTNGPGAAVPWRRHEAPFIRLVLHLAYRARACGVWLFAEDVFDGIEYDLSSTCRYGLALGDEPARLAGCDFATIARTPPPAAFIELWQADMRRLRCSNRIADSRTLAVCECKPLL